DTYRSAIIDYWCDADNQGETPWLWLARHLQGLLRSAAEQASAEDRLVAAEPALKSLSKGAAGPADLLTLSSSQGISIKTLACNFS
ncbi:hypothetical protein NL323_30725, partial [Klebsiella pneumoniae]|nr:hypothetical protein [Klebsiella pneumoniae]